MKELPITDADLHAYVDGLLEEKRRPAVEAYIASRSELSEKVAAYQQQNQLLHDLFDPVIEEPIPARFKTRPGASNWKWMRYAAMLGWLILGGMIGWGMQGRTSTLSAANDFPQWAAVAHAVYSVEEKRPVEVTDEQAMVNWMTKRMQVKVTVPHLDELGYALIGGRLLPGQDGPACQMMYQDNQGRRITIYMTRSTKKAEPQPIKTTQQNTIQVAYWQDGTLDFAVSGSVDSSELVRVAEAVSARIRN